MIAHLDIPTWAVNSPWQDPTKPNLFRDEFQLARENLPGEYFTPIEPYRWIFQNDGENLFINVTPSAIEDPTTSLEETIRFIDAAEVTFVSVRSLTDLPLLFVRVAIVAVAWLGAITADLAAPICA